MSSIASTEEKNPLESGSSTSQEQTDRASPTDLEKLEEEKLKTKYPTGLKGPSIFLQKRLQKGQKYFDSGDYQMAKQKGGGIKQVFANKVSTGDAIPTPESVPARKTSIIQPCSNKFTTTS